MADYLLTEKADGVAILTLNRPNQLNALNRELSAALHEAVARAVADDAVGCIVITGAGQKAFSAGGDIHEQREDDKNYTQAELDALGAERARGFYEIGACAKPTIGMINGLAYGGAGVLASSLDMRVAVSTRRSASWPRRTAASTPRGRCPTRSAGPSRRSCCSPAGR